MVTPLTLIWCRRGGFHYKVHTVSERLYKKCVAAAKPLVLFTAADHDVHQPINGRII